MILRGMNGGQPGLLVSVRSANEALAALAGGANVIDVKEPARGPLGSADAATVADVVRVVANRAIVTAAAGELCDIRMPRQDWPGCAEILDGVALFKFGLAGCARHGDWRRLLAALPDNTHPVLVVYADWGAAEAPEPDALLVAANGLGSPALVIDTWDKSAGTLFDHWPADDVQAFVSQIHAAGMSAVLAGSLSLPVIQRAMNCEPDLIAVRGAACEGGRNGAVSRERVAELCQAMAVSNGPLRRS